MIMMKKKMRGKNTSKFIQLEIVDAIKWPEATTNSSEFPPMNFVSVRSKDENEWVNEIKLQNSFSNWLKSKLSRIRHNRMRDENSKEQWWLGHMTNFNKQN